MDSKQYRDGVGWDGNTATRTVQELYCTLASANELLTNEAKNPKKSCPSVMKLLIHKAMEFFDRSWPLIRYS